MISYSFFLILLSILMGWLSVPLFFYLLKKFIIPAHLFSLKKKMILRIKYLDIEREVTEKFDLFDIEKELTPLIEQRLDHLIGQLKQEVPMGGDSPVGSVN